jgi:hypothetical protein
MEPSSDKEDPKIPPSQRALGKLGQDERDIWPSDEDEPEEKDELEGELEDKDYDPLDDDLDEEMAPEGVPAEPAPAPEKAAPSPVPDPGSESKAFLPSFTRKEVLWLGALGVAVLGIIIYSVSLFFSAINTSTPDQVDFPVKGDNLVIREIETYWRKPDRETDLGVRLSAKFIPAADIELKESGSGALRFFFENPEGDRVGDSVTLAFSGGSFDKSGSETASFNGTSGLVDIGDYNDYLTEKVHFWHLVVMEGPGLRAKGSEFKEILRMRIFPKRR